MPRDDREIRISLDGNKWCALRGENLQEGEAGFGRSRTAALLDLLGQMTPTREDRDQYLRETLETIRDITFIPPKLCVGVDCRACLARDPDDERIYPACILLMVRSTMTRCLVRATTEGDA